MSIILPSLYPEHKKIIDSNWSNEDIDFYCKQLRSFTKPVQYVGLFGPKGYQEFMAALNFPKQSRLIVYTNESTCTDEYADFEFRCLQLEHHLIRVEDGNVCSCPNFLVKGYTSTFLNLDYYRLKDLGKDYYSSFRKLGEQTKGISKYRLLRFLTYSRGGGVEQRIKKINEQFFGKSSETLTISRAFARRYGSEYYSGNKRDAYYSFTGERPTIK